MPDALTPEARELKLLEGAPGLSRRDRLAVNLGSFAKANERIAKAVAHHRQIILDSKNAIAAQKAKRFRRAAE